MDTEAPETASMEAQETPTDEMPRSCRCKHNVLHRLNGWFLDLGFVIAGFPRCTILIGILFTCLCGLGLGNFRQESRVEKLWVPQDTRELRDQEMAASFFPVAVQVEQLIVTSSSGDVATQASLLQLIELLKLSESIHADVDGENVTYSDLCLVAHSANASYCHTSSVLDLFYDASLESVPQRGYLETVRAKVATLSDADVKETIGGSPRSWLGGPLRRDDILHATSHTDGTLQCEAFRVTIFMKANPKSVLREWESVWISKLDVEVASGVDSLSWNIQASRSNDDALTTSLSYDFPKMFAGYALLVVYVCTMLGRPHLVRMRLALGLNAVLCVILATICTAGIASAFGLFWGPVHSVLPLLMLGIGADDAFVITSSFDRVTEDHKESLPRRERLALALSKAGSAVSVTSLTNCCAFFIGSLTSLPALRIFAIWAGIGVLLNFVFMATLFVACLSLDARRQEKGRVDVLTCLERDADKADCCGIQAGILRRFFEKGLAPLLLLPSVRVAVLVVTAVAIGICSYGITRLHQEFSPSLFYLDGTHVSEFHDVLQLHFPKRYIPVYIYSGPVAYETEAVQRKLLGLCSESTGIVAKNSISLDGSTSCWYSQLHSAFNLSDSQVFSADTFYPSLRQFLSGGGAHFGSHLSFDDQGRLNASRFAMRLVHLDSNEDQVDAMHSLQAAVDGGDLGAFPFADPFTFFAQFSLLKAETFQSVGSSLVVVFIVTVCMIGNPLVCLIVFAGVAATVVEILGLVHYWDVNLNSVAVITLAVAVGLSVDFSAHIGLEFMEGVGSREERMTQALEALGPSLVHGGTSTILVVSLLVIARSYIFRVFFKMLFLTLSLGMFHGLVFVPVVLGLIGPDGFYQSLEEKDKAGKAISIRTPGGRRSRQVAWSERE